MVSDSVLMAVLPAQERLARPREACVAQLSEGGEDEDRGDDLVGLAEFPYLPAGLDDVVDKVVPELQRRDLFRTEYEGPTLRENLGLPRPANRFFEAGIRGARGPVG